MGLPGLSTEGTGDRLWWDWIKPKGLKKVMVEACCTEFESHFGFGVLPFLVFRACLFD